MATFEVPQGRAKNVRRQVTADGVTAYTAATTPFLSSDALACQVWAGNGYASAAAPAVAWVDANTATFSINFAASDTSALAPGEYPYAVTATRGGTAGEVDRGTVLLLPTPGTATADDLVTPQVLGAVLDAVNLTDAERLLLPTLVTAASTSVRRYCNRHFTLKTFDELYSVPPPFSQVVLNQFPVQSVTRVATNPRAAATVTNTGSANYRATVQLATTGDASAGFTATGLTLTRYYSGTSASSTIAFGNSTLSVSALATAVNALGNGWSATYDSDLGGWALSDLRPVQGVIPATGGGADLEVYADDLGWRLDEAAGLLYLRSPAGLGNASPRFGPFFGNDLAEASPYGGTLGVRVVYTAGVATVPSDVQTLTAEVVKAVIDRLRTDSGLRSESDGVLSWTARPLDELAMLPPWVRQGLAPWVNHRA